jgi:putative oxidoreductase
MPARILSYLFQALSAGIFFFIAWHRISGQPASVETFRILMLGNFGRYGAAIAEAITGVCLLLPELVWAGALMGLGTLSGAIFFHIAIIGQNVGGDDGLLFQLATMGLISCIMVLYLKLFQEYPGMLPGPDQLHGKKRAQALRRLRTLKGKR